MDLFILCEQFTYLFGHSLARPPFIIVPGYGNAFKLLSALHHIIKY